MFSKERSCSTSSLHQKFSFWEDWRSWWPPTCSTARGPGAPGMLIYKARGRDGHREGENEKGNRDGEEVWKVHHPPVPVCSHGWQPSPDSSATASRDGYMESANPAVLCSHSMGQSQNGQILPVHVLSKASEFAHAAGENSTKAAISGTQRKRKTGIKVQSVLHGRAWLCGVYRMCVTFALGLWSWEPKEALKCKSHTLEMVSWRRRGRWRGFHGQRLECCLGRMFSTGCYPRSCALHGESHSAWIFTGHVV